MIRKEFTHGHGYENETYHYEIVVDCFGIIKGDEYDTTGPMTSTPGVGTYGIRPLVMLPIDTPGYNDNGVWRLEKELGKLLVHYYIEGEPEETRELVPDKGPTTYEEGDEYTTSPLTDNEYDKDKYEYTGRTTGDEVEGKIVGGKTTEVTYWYKLKKHVITTEVKGPGGHITGEEKELEEEVGHLEDSKNEIVIVPNEGYYIKRITVNDEEIEFTPAEDGTYTMKKFEQMEDDKHIVVEFAKIEEEPPDESEPEKENPQKTPNDDNSIATGVLPNTGENTFIFILIAISVISAVVTFIKYKAIKLK